MGCQTQNKNKMTTTDEIINEIKKLPVNEMWEIVRRTTHIHQMEIECKYSNKRKKIEAFQERYNKKHSND